MENIEENEEKCKGKEENEEKGKENDKCKGKKDWKKLRTFLEISSGKRLKSHMKKIEKSDFAAPSWKFFLLAPVCTPFSEFKI